MRRIRPQVQVFSAKAATGNSSVANVKDFKDISVAVTSTLNSSLTFKFKGSPLDNVDLTAAQAVGNEWDYVAFADLQSAGSLVAGDTGVTLNNDTVANNTRLYTINTNHLALFAVEVTSYTDGALDAYVIATKE